MKRLLPTVIIISVLCKISASPQCRDKFGFHEPRDFYRSSCAWCYFFLFPGKPSVVLSGYTNNNLLLKNNFNFGYNITPDPLDLTVCDGITPEECQRWKSCCLAARQCCNKQQSKNSQNGSCPGTWDGYSCWQSSEPGLEHYLSCPSYLKYSVPTEKSTKTCLSNGAWLTRNGTEWTDYTMCLNYNELKTSIFLNLACILASIALLIPAVFIFCRYRSLRKQQRIQLHINFFVSFIFSGTVVLMWDMLVTYERLTNENVTDTVLYKNTAGCRVLSFLKIYFKSTNYAWMFCEGVYLQRLIGNAFAPPKTLIPLYGIGWVFPLISTLIYGVLRAVLADESCWALSFNNKEWIIYAPNLACLVMNLVFLCNIMWILLTQIQTHPNEPNNFRRALRATFVLIPLFGVQLCVTIYRPPSNVAGSLIYDRFSAFVMNSQGFLVAMIFCFVNGEVHSHLKRTWKRRIMERSGTGSRKTNTLLSGNNTVTFRSETDTIEQRRISGNKVYKRESCNFNGEGKYKGAEKIQMTPLKSCGTPSYEECGATRV